ncbi:uncharacterized protein LOC144310718 [Canis aureus]
MAHSEVRGGDAPSAAGMCEGATGETLPAPPPRPHPRPGRSCPDRPPRRGVTTRSRGGNPGCRSVLPGAGTNYIPGAAPAPARPRPPRDGEHHGRSPARRAPEPLGSFPLHHRGELGAFSSLSGPPCLSLRPRQHCDWRWRPSKVPVLVSALQRHDRQEPPRARHSPPRHARAPEPAGTFWRSKVWNHYHKAKVKVSSGLHSSWRL